MTLHIHLDSGTVVSVAFAAFTSFIDLRAEVEKQLKQSERFVLERGDQIISVPVKRIVGYAIV